MADLFFPFNIGCEEKKRENIAMQQRTVIITTTRNSRVCTASDTRKLFFKITKLQAIQKKTFLLNQDNHAKKQPRYRTIWMMSRSR